MRLLLPFSAATRATVVRQPLLSLLVLGLATACVDRPTGEDQEERHRRCTFISFEGIDAEGNAHSLYSDATLGHSPQLCTCSTEAENADFSDGGYRDYVNDLAFEECKRISRAENYMEDNCTELFERGSFGITYGGGPIPPDAPPTDPHHEWETPLCDEQENAGGCGVS